tara:strand:+ start:451 stop:678 length:228 start_codon:yes stop_codon:yes gene_type:complete
METLDKMIIDFENKKFTHPHIATLWQAYLKTQKLKIKNLIDKGNFVLNNLDSNNDIPFSLLIIIYSIFTDTDNLT